MKENVLDAIGKIIVEKVRDDAISYFDGALRGERHDIYGRKIHEAFTNQNISETQFLYDFIPHVVDSAISGFLQVLDHEQTTRIKLVVGDNLELVDPDASLEAEYSYSDGWVKKFSKERLSKMREAAEENFPYKKKEADSSG